MYKNSWLPVSLLISISVQVNATAANISWQDWSGNLFERAKKEKRFVILDLKANWCHWCHVMDNETYNNPKVENIIHKKFVAVKVDQDARPDLSNRYEQYGWPATIIFDASGNELVKKAGYIAPEKMIALLNNVAAGKYSSVNKGKDGNITSTGNQEGSQEKAVQYANNHALSEALRKELTDKYFNGYDAVNGGWKTLQKFLDADNIEYAMCLTKLGNENAVIMVKQTLDAAENLIDPVWGGMYQYSVEDNWKHPHYEKIMSVQADALRTYAFAYALFGNPAYLQSAIKIYNYLEKYLSSPDGAFYTSQDADVVRGQTSSNYFSLDNAGRLKQGVPNIDKHIYARENGWAINAIVTLYMVTGDKQYLDRAIKAADYIVKNRSLPDNSYRHDESDAAGPYLGDTLYMGRAFLALYAATQDKKWLIYAQETADAIANNFIYEKAGANKDVKAGFVTAAVINKDLDKPVYLLEENIALARFANLLYHYGGRKQDKELAEQAMRYLATAEIARQKRVMVAGILMSDKEMNSDPMHVTVVAPKSDANAKTLFMSALKYPLFYKQIDWYDKAEGLLPNMSVEFPDLPKAAAFTCAAGRCSLPAFDANKLQALMDSFYKENK
jgi:uncharacterized protein YyaL (SSP411 family)